MILPQLNEIPQTRSIIDVFGGYNHNHRINDGEFYDEKNMSSHNYPVLSTRQKRGVYEPYKEGKKIFGIIAKEEIGVFYCDDDGFKFKYGNTTISLTTISKEMSPYIATTQLVSMGVYVIVICKDSNGNDMIKNWIKTSGTLTYGEIDQTFVIRNQQGYKAYICDENGEKIEYTAEKPPEFKDGTVVMNPNVLPIQAYKFSATMEEWIPTTVYTRIEYITYGNQVPLDVTFKEGDTINVKKYDGVVLPSYEQFYGYRQIVKVGYDPDNIDERTGYIVIDGIIPSPVNLGESADGNTILYTLTKDMPQMDFIVESNNRLWGCKYGYKDGKLINEIYASKLGSFDNWNSFKGISTDSYAVSLGSDGAFTGAITHLGYPLFFKENCMHKIYGTEPSSYQLQTTQCRGVKNGCDKSLAIVNEILYYQSTSGICVYDGSLPTEISQAFGDIKYSEGVAGGMQGKYYISMRNDITSTDVKPRYELFCFDSKTGIWHKEDNTRFENACTLNDMVYYLSQDQISTVYGTEEKKVRWMLETGNIGTDSPDTKYVSKIGLRALLDINASMSMYIKYNSMGDWLYIGKIVGSTLQSFTVPIKPKRCDHFRLKFEGEGNINIYSITKTIEQGGEH